MKKLLTLTSRAALMLLLLFIGLNQASATDFWIGGSAIYVNGVWYYATSHGTTSEWCSGGSFNGANLGTITSLNISGHSQIWEEKNANWNGKGEIIMSYKIDSDSPVELILTYKEFTNNNNVFELGGKTWSTQSIDISAIPTGNHTIEVWFNQVSNNLWDSNNGANYKANFTIPAPQSITVSGAGYATYVSPYPLDYTSREIKAYTAKVNTETGKIVLSQINKVPANTPVVLYKDGGKTEDVPICFTATDTPADNDLIAGTGAKVATQDGDNYNYILNNVDGIGFYKANGQTVATNRAYLQTTYNVAAAGARLTMAFEDETTGITSIKAENSNVYFDLQGRRVAQPTKGLYIVNGKKYFAK